MGSQLSKPWSCQRRREQTCPSVLLTRLSLGFFLFSPFIFDFPGRVTHARLKHPPTFLQLRCTSGSQRCSSCCLLLFALLQAPLRDCTKCSLKKNKYQSVHTVFERSRLLLQGAVAWSLRKHRKQVLWARRALGLQKKNIFTILGAWSHPHFHVSPCTK